MAQMTTKRLLSEDQNPASDSGFGSVPNCILKCEPTEPEKNGFESPAAKCALKCETKAKAEKNRQMATKRLLSEDQDPASDSGFGSAPETSSPSGGNSPQDARGLNGEARGHAGLNGEARGHAGFNGEAREHAGLPYSGVPGPPESKISRLQDTLEPALLLRTSARVQRMKEGHRDPKESEHSDLGDEEPENSESVIVNSELELNAKQKRAWEQWSSEDKAIFFESLNECGKNFDAIQVFFHNRNKKNNKLFTSTKESNSLLNKNKEQIRTFYYRTWHKICKYVDFAEYKHLKKSSKELYGLINFGELRKRLGSQLDDKTGVKLRELVFKGHTTVKIKGKSHRLRTPTCAALRRLSETLKLEESSSSNVPSKISLILTPLTTDDFDKVHRLALTNPHVCLTIRPGRSLNSVFEHLKHRWKKIHHQELHLVTKDGSTNVPKITVMGPTTSASLSLSNLKLIDLNNSAEIQKPNAETSTETNCADFGGDTEDPLHETTEKSPVKIESVEKPPMTSFHEIFGTFVKTEKLTETSTVAAESTDNTETISVDLGNPPQGWTTDSSKDISIGEIFLMTHGNNAKQQTNLELQYNWKSQNDTQNPQNSQNPLQSTPKCQQNSAFSFLSKLASAELNKKLPNSSSKIVKTLSFEATNGISSNDANHVANFNHDANHGASLGESEESGFKRPTLPPLSKPTIQQHQAFRQQLVNLMPKYNMRKGRPISRPKRPSTTSSSNARPLQPSTLKATSDGRIKVRLMPSAHGITFTHPVISIQSPLHSPSHNSDKPDILKALVDQQRSGIPDQIQITASTSSSFSQNSSRNNKTPNHPNGSSNIFPREDMSRRASNERAMPKNVSCNNGAEFEVHADNSNDSLSAALSFFDTSRSADRFLDSVLENSNSSLLQTPTRVRPTPPTSPSRAVSNDSWIPDLSSLFNRSASSNSQGSSTNTPNKSGHIQNSVLTLHNEDTVQSNGSSLLSSLFNRSAPSSSSNTPNKNGNVQTSLDKFGLDQNSKSNKFGHVDHNEDSVQSNGSEVDRQLLSMMSENSVDFTSKFAKLASAVVGSNVEDT